MRFISIFVLMKTPNKNAESKVVTTAKDLSEFNMLAIDNVTDVKNVKALERTLKALESANEGKTLTIVGERGRKWNETYLQTFVPNGDLNDERVSKKARSLARVRFNSFAAPFADINAATLTVAQRNELKRRVFIECNKAFNVVKSVDDLSLLKDSYRGSSDRFAGTMFKMLDKIC